MLFTLLAVIRIISSASSALSYDGVLSFAETPAGEVLIGTCKGLNRWDGRDIEAFPLKGLSYNGYYISSIYTDASGRLLVGTDDGVYEYNDARNRFVPLKTLCRHCEVPTNRVYHIVADGKGAIWMSSRAEGLFVWKGKQMRRYTEVSHIHRIYPVGDEVYMTSFSGKVYHLTDEQWDEPFPSLSVREIFPAGEALFLLASDGLWRYDGDETAPVLVLGSRHLGTGCPSGDGSGIWLSTPEGFILVSPEGKVLRSVPYQGEAPHAMIQARSGDIFAAPKLGLIHCRLGEGAMRNVTETEDGTSLEGVQVNGFAFWNGKMYIATGRRGLLAYDPQARRLSLCKAEKSLPDSLTAVAAVDEGLFLATLRGALLLHPDTGEVRWFHPGWQFNSLFVSRDGTVWAGVYDALCRFSPQQKAFLPVNIPHAEPLGNPDPDGRPRNQIGYVREDGDGKLWLATYSSGICCYDPVRDTVETWWNPQTGVNNFRLISSVQTGRDGSVWAVGFTSGLALHRRGEAHFACYTPENSPLPTNVFYAAEEDADGNMWFSSDAGIFRYAPSTDSWRHYDRKDGLAADLFRKAAGKAPDGSIYFGFKDGFVCFSPAEAAALGEPLSQPSRSLPGWIILTLGLSAIAAASGILYVLEKRGAPEESESPDAVFLRKVEALVSSRMGDSDFGVGVLEKELNCSRSTLTRRIKRITGKVPINYIRDSRLAEAARSLREGKRRVSEVCYDVGFSSPSYFSRCFKARYGCSPSDYADTHKSAASPS